jgi:hypothetical protein
MNVIIVVIVFMSIATTRNNLDIITLFEIMVDIALFMIWYCKKPMLMYLHEFFHFHFYMNLYIFAEIYMTSVNDLHLHRFSQLKIDFHDLTLTHPK